MNYIGLQHEYYFEFSDSVTVSFYLSDINKGTYSSTEGWNDQLIFSGKPVFSEMESVNVIDSIVEPLEEYLGLVKVTYPKTKGFSIKHGLGTDQAPNPGYIKFSALHLSKEIIADLVDVYPSPSSDFITLDSKSLDDYQVRVFDAIGQEVYHTMILSRSQQSVDISNWVAGMYLLQIYDGKKRLKTKKIIKI